MEKNSPIGFFDSGVGGLSVLKEALAIMPNENYIYFGDSKNAPYGIKNVEEVRELTLKAAEFLYNKGVKAMVIACNTATSAAIINLREIYTDIPVIGIEPAVKPAAEHYNKGKVFIMATPMTLKEKKFNNLMEKYKNEAEIIPMPCAGLVELIEAEKLDSKEVYDYLKNKFKDYNKEEIGAIVLGCTHYPFIKKTLDKVMDGKVPLIDGGAGTSNELKRQLEKLNMLNDSEKEGYVKIFNSSEDEELIKFSYRLINRPI